MPAALKREIRNTVLPHPRDRGKKSVRKRKKCFPPSHSRKHIGSRWRIGGRAERGDARFPLTRERLASDFSSGRLELLSLDGLAAPAGAPHLFVIERVVPLIRGHPRVFLPRSFQANFPSRLGQRTVLSSPSPTVVPVSYTHLTLPTILLV